MIGISSRLTQSPLFIVGCGRSGTTAVYYSLNEHSSIHMNMPDAPHAHYYGRLAYQFLLGPRADYFASSTPLGPGALSRQLRDVLIQTMWHKRFGLGKRAYIKRLTESTLLHKKFYWGGKIFPRENDCKGLALLFSQMRIIYVIRNGISVVHSMGAHPDFNSMRFEERCKLWNERAQAYEYLRGQSFVYEIRQESFAAHGSEILAHIQQWLQIPYESAPGEFAQSTIVHPLGSRTQPGNPYELLNRTSPWNSWSSLEKETFVHVCGKSMEKLGYPVE